MVQPVAPPPPSPEEVASEAARQQEALGRKQSQEQLAQYRVLGYLSREGVLHAFLGRGREIYIVHTGEMLEGRILVKSIDASSVVLREVHTNLEATLSLQKASTEAA